MLSFAYYETTMNLVVVAGSPKCGAPLVVPTSWQISDREKAIHIFFISTLHKQSP
jgi:hypothetical protein